MSGFVEKVGEAAHKVGEAVKHAGANAHDRAAVVKSKAGEKYMEHMKFVDLEIQFIGASGLPKLDIVGSADPYFVAKLDDRISFVSTVQRNTLAPVWNELWRVKNVPVTADLNVQLLDKDVGTPHDDYVGKFKTSVAPGAKEAEIEGPLFRRDRGTFWLKIDSKPSESENPHKHPFQFNGPIRYSRHTSPTVGKLTNLNNARLYSTWKMYIIGVSEFFGDNYQHWNKDYKAAQSIFQGPTSIAVRTGIHSAHRMLYARSTSNGFGVIDKPSDVVKILHGGGDENPNAANTETNAFFHRVKPAVYTYIISSEDDSFRFSETGAAFFVDFASKHALHANCAETVRYSGEFHPRPEGGWAKFNDSIPDEQVNWELVIDNNSGTYAPDKALLPTLQQLLEFNFPGFKIFALDHGDPELTASREATREYALKVRGVDQNELQPHVHESGEETLLQHTLSSVHRSDSIPTD